MVAAAVIGGSVASAAIGAGASRSAAAQQGQSAQEANNIQIAGMQNSMNALNPYAYTGQAEIGDIRGDMAAGRLGGSFTPQNFLDNQDPGYGWQLQQGQQALQNSQAAGSGVLSGAALKGLIGYNQGMASTGYQNAYNRWLSQQQNRYGMMSGIASLGENAAASAGNSGVGYATGAANAAIAGGNAAAAGTVGAANAINGGISNGSGYMYLNSLMNKTPSSGGSTVIGGDNPTGNWTQFGVGAD